MSVNYFYVIDIIPAILVTSFRTFSEKEKRRGEYYNCTSIGKKKYHFLI